MKGMVIIMKKVIFGIVVVGILMSIVFLFYIGLNTNNSKEDVKKVEQPIQGSEEANSTTSETLFNPSSVNLEEAILTPKGYNRINATKETLASFIRSYPLKKNPSEVLLYNGKSKSNQNSHVAVFDFPISNKDLQQCADSIMMVYAEYFWANGQYDKIKFHFVSGFLAEYPKWRDGYRIIVSGNQVSWAKKTSYDDSHECFRQYLEVVYSYASTLSLGKESVEINEQDIQVGDIFINPGSPGHVVMIVDICENESGKKAFLLAQGYMPAQDFHVLKNPAKTNNPWYDVSEINYPFQTPEYSFQKGSLKRPQY